MTSRTDKYDFIINRRSGTVMNMGEQAVREELEQAFGDKAGTITFIDGQDIIPSVRSWVAAHAGSTRGMIIGGGDGTVLTAAGEIMNRTDVTMGVLPMGTQNLFSRRLGFLADFKKAAAQYRDSEACDVDVGIVNGMYFLVGLMIDQNSVRFFEAREELRDRKKLKALWKGMKLAVPKSESYTVVSDGGPAASISGITVAITSNPLQPRANKGGIFTLDTDKLKDIGGNLFAMGREAAGTMCMHVFAPGLMDSISLLKGIRKGDWLEHDAVTVQPGRSFTITPEKDAAGERKIIIDGEIKTTSATMDVQMIAKALKVYRPK